MEQKDPRVPILIGMGILIVLSIGGIIWAVMSATNGSLGREDVNVSFIDAEDPVTGKEDSSVVLRMYSDFQCPACRTAEEGVDYIRKTYGDRLKIIWNDFPLEASHQNARRAANAARCAEAQGKFWEYHDLLFARQDLWASLDDPSETFLQYAKELQLNEGYFDQCNLNRTYDSKIIQDMKEGSANRVDGTPTFFINSRRIVGGLSAAQWDNELARLLKNVASTK